MKRGGLRGDEATFAAFHGARARFKTPTDHGAKADAANGLRDRVRLSAAGGDTPIRADTASSATHKPLERAVLAAVIKALALHPRVAWAHRLNVGAFRDGDRFIRVGFVGCSDIIGQMTDGRFLAVEVKRPGGKPTEAQVEFLGRVARAGGVAFVAWGVDDVRRGLADEPDAA